MVYLHQIDPIALSIGPLKIHWYGVMYLLGFASAWWLGRSRILAGRLPGVDMERFSDLLFYAMMGVVLGGRVGYVLFYGFDAFRASPLMLFKVWDGGMSFHGGLLGVMVGVWLWSRKQKLHYFDSIDFIATLTAPGLGFGRLGNFIGAELWGKPTGQGWGVIFPTAPEFRGSTLAQIQTAYADGTAMIYARHPSQLYEALLEGLVIFLVVWVYSRKPRPRYAVAGIFALLYGVFRFAVEFVRVPDNGVYLAWDWFTKGQLLSLPLIALGIVLLWLSRRAPTLQPAVPGTPVATDALVEPAAPERAAPARAESDRASDASTAAHADLATNATTTAATASTPPASR